MTTVQRIREIIKVHCMAADSAGRKDVAMALLELLQAVDDELQDGANNS